MLSGDYHSVAPRHGFAVWDFFYYSEGLVADKVVVHLLLPVDRDGRSRVTRLRCGVWVNVYFYFWPFHLG